jgi:arylformamidase
MKKNTIIEMSHRMIPQKENFQLQRWTYDVTTLLPDVKHRPDIWYVLSDFLMSSHMGTHIEFPFHHYKEGQDAADFPIDKLIGPGVVLDFRHKKGGDSMTLEEVKKADSGRIKKGDMIWIRQDADKRFRQKDWAEYAHLTPDAMAYLMSFDPPIIGTDGTGFEVPGTDYQPNHLAMFKKGIGMVESACNLGEIGKDRALFFILPLPIEGADACPVRIIAIKGEMNCE